MEIRTTAGEGGIAFVEVLGEVDASSSPDLEKALLDLARRPHTRIVLDFSGVSFISSSGLRVLFQADKLERLRGGEMPLFGLKPQVLKVFQLSGFDQILHIAATRDEAAGL